MLIMGAYLQQTSHTEGALMKVKTTVRAGFNPQPDPPGRSRG